MGKGKVVAAFFPVVQDDEVCLPLAELSVYALDSLWQIRKVNYSPAWLSPSLAWCDALQYRGAFGVHRSRLSPFEGKV